MYPYVFLSFRGEDVRKNFLSHLNRQLSRKGIRTFKQEEDDEKKERGKQISPSLLRGISASKVALVVLSKNYADSTWCLEELVKIMGHARKESTAVVPVFYEVCLSDVRSERGIFGEALERLGQVEDPETLQTWKNALIKLTNKQGFFSHESEDDSKLSRDITRHVSDLLSKSPLHKLHVGKACGDTPAVKKTSLTRLLSKSGTISEISKCRIAMDHHMEFINTLLDLESTSEVRAVGISGVRGIGKTTIARRIYQELSSAFQDRCFLETPGNILDHVSGTQGYWKTSIVMSPCQKLTSALQDHCFIGTSRNIHDQGHDLVASSGLRKELLPPRSLKRKAMHFDLSYDDQKRTRFCNKRVLVIVDNIDTTKQLEEIMKDVNLLGSGSRVILITTQNRSSLLTCGVEHVYEVNCLNYDEALEFFSKCTFKKQYPPANFEQLSVRAVKLTGCLPLGLKLLGSFLCGRTEEDWESELQRLESRHDKAIVELSELRT